MPCTVTSIARCTVYGGFAAVVLTCLYSVYLASGPAAFELDAVSGTAAKARLEKFGNWPKSVDPRDIEKVTWSYQSTIDIHSSWYRIELKPDAATSWMDKIHETAVAGAKVETDHLNEGAEGVHRMIPGPPPLHRQTSKTPNWWQPPAIDFRATEVMIWYKSSDSGVGRATYSAFDPSAGVLWIYEYSAQHDQLWSRRNVPPGEVFSTLPSPKG